jgi:3-hydroxybutyryl-CoA dehydrogenase
LLEACCRSEERRTAAEAVFAFLGKKAHWLPDDPGFITARVVSMIINEAYLALAEGVSAKEEIDTAMKLGTAYPYGPFEWAEKIGQHNVVALLQKLAQSQPRYTPAALLIQDAARLT